MSQKTSLLTDMHRKTRPTRLSHGHIGSRQLQGVQLAEIRWNCYGNNDTIYAEKFVIRLNIAVHLDTTTKPSANFLFGHHCVTILTELTLLEHSLFWDTVSTNRRSSSDSKGLPIRPFLPVSSQGLTKSTQITCSLLCCVLLCSCFNLFLLFLERKPYANILRLRESEATWNEFCEFL